MEWALVETSTGESIVLSAVVWILIELPRVRLLEVGGLLVFPSDVWEWEGISTTGEACGGSSVW